MVETASKRSFWSLGISGLVGAVIGIGGTFFSQQQANTAQNHYYMELDRLRHNIVLNDTVDFGEKFDDLQLLKEVKQNGFRSVFEQNLERDIEEISIAIENIKRAEEAAAEAAADADDARAAAEIAAKAATSQENARAAAAAQARKEKAVRINPLIFENCGRGTGIHCP